MVRAASYPEIGIDSPASVSVRGIRGESGRHGFISPYGIAYKLRNLRSCQAPFLDWELTDGDADDRLAAG